MLVLSISWCWCSYCLFQLCVVPTDTCANTVATYWYTQFQVACLNFAPWKSVLVWVLVGRLNSNLEAVQVWSANLGQARFEIECTGRVHGSSLSKVIVGSKLQSVCSLIQFGRTFCPFKKSHCLWDFLCLVIFEASVWPVSGLEDIAILNLIISIAQGANTVTQGPAQGVNTNTAS